MCVMTNDARNRADDAPDGSRPKSARRAAQADSARPAATASHAAVANDGANDGRNDGANGANAGNAANDGASDTSANNAATAPAAARAESETLEHTSGIPGAALERLVQRALAESQHSGARGAPRSEVVVAAAARLERLLETYGHVDGLRERLAEQREALTSELSRLRSAVVARRGFLEADGDAAVWPVDPERWRTLRWRVQARLAALADSGANAGAARVAAQELLDLFAKERAASLTDLRRRSDAEVVHVERRLSALAATVEQAEHVLEILREAPMDGAGVASYFRAPEGLDPADQRRELKLAMLDGVFRQNFELQRRKGED